MRNWLGAPDGHLPVDQVRWQLSQGAPVRWLWPSSARLLVAGVGLTFVRRVGRTQGLLKWGSGIVYQVAYPPSFLFAGGQCSGALATHSSLKKSSGCGRSCKSRVSVLPGSLVHDVHAILFRGRSPGAKIPVQRIQFNVHSWYPSGPLHTRACLDVARKALGEEHGRFA